MSTPVVTDPQLRRGVCTSCGAPLLWGRTARGKPCPLDAEPELRYVIVSAQLVVLRRVYRSHFQTCPNAAQHRKPKAAAAGFPGSQETTA